jgi:hypothetical protein
VRVRFGLIHDGRDIFILLWKRKTMGSRALQRDKPIQQVLNLVAILLD